MILTLKYFGLLVEVTKCKEEQIEFSGTQISELLETIFSRYPELKNKDFQIAQNNTITNDETEISSEEIALLPPFAGG
ncbi:MAG: MoaD/ThiS family protein [Lentimicrobiaceae bacterium]|jgi:molybdopterin synthase sulfur carrier subunit|nr:MoaD/ThiS family protein [Lentimicrobiaceae bacterium]MCP4910919.1 MoaD/ThiS family protein [Bacteroidota bacterium]MBT3455330.1 MoaD/ThiS family protein [Lentimicrobiaceae bacterium]MBT3818830.1 MoaD/ThiS family protein [Lentimicrobiaceae bacterium]MBT4062097.1 MoaD/ThiS family protein [Lentimicrobiaceae bacterium]